MKISFLVTFYNQESYVQKSIDSILKIEKPIEWEILIGDDGSSDKTVEKIKPYLKLYPNNIFLYEMPRDLNRKYDSVKRASSNRLNLLKHSKGDYFCILDGDDYYCDRFFVSMALDAYKTNKDISVVAFRHKNVYSNREIEEASSIYKLQSGLIDTKIYLERYYTPAGACVFRKIWGEERQEFIEGIGYFDDNNIVINSLNYGLMYYVNRIVYAYRQSDTSVYNSMNKLEKAILNTQGFDVDVNLINDRYRRSIIRRYSDDIVTMYEWRNELIEFLGKEKYDRYVEASSHINNSLAYSIFKFSEGESCFLNNIRGVMQQIKTKVIIKKRLKKLQYLLLKCLGGNG